MATRLKLTGTKGAVYKLEMNGKNIGNKELKGAVEVIAEFVVAAEGCKVQPALWNRFSNP
jgi:hypothetical protein